MGKILCHITDLKNWTYITNNAFWHPLPAVDFSKVIGEKRSFFTKFKLWATWRTNVRTLVYYIRLVEHSTRNWGSSPLQIFVQGGRKL